MHEIVFQQVHPPLITLESVKRPSLHMVRRCKYIANIHDDINCIWEYTLIITQITHIGIQPQTVGPLICECICIACIASFLRCSDMQFVNKEYVWTLMHQIRNHWDISSISCMRALSLMAGTGSGSGTRRRRPVPRPRRPPRDPAPLLLLLHPGDPPRPAAPLSAGQRIHHPAGNLQARWPSRSVNCMP